MTTSNTLRRLAASTAVALAFSPLANAAGLMDDVAAVNTYRPAFSIALAKATGDDMARGRAGGFMVELEKALTEPSDKTRIVDYPLRANAELLRITAVVPPKGLEALPIPVCAEQHNKVVGVWNISAKGEVVTVPWTGLRQSESPTSAACKQFIVAARTDINQRLAQTQPTPQPAQPPPVAAAAVVTVAMAPAPFVARP